MAVAPGLIYDLSPAQRGSLTLVGTWMYSDEASLVSVGLPAGTVDGVRNYDGSFIDPIRDASYLLHASATWCSADERWRTSLFVRNLTDEAYAVTGTFVAGLFNFVQANDPAIGDLKSVITCSVGRSGGHPGMAAACALRVTDVRLQVSNHYLYVLNMSPPPNAGEKTWQQTKSERTRTSILDAAIECFYKLGYFNTTTESIAREAGVSRGAMLHHFPTRADLIKAAVEHLNQLRLDMFTQEELRTQEGAEHTRVAEGIDAYWRQLGSKAFVVFHELKVAARTDPELAKVLRPALKAFNRAQSRATEQVFPDLAQSEAYERTTFMTQYLLEGMALTKLLDGGAGVPDKMILDWLKTELRRSYSDVQSVSRRGK